MIKKTNDKITLVGSPAVISIVVFISSILYAAGACFFMMPHDLAFGGTTGLAVLLTRIIPLSASTISSFMNIILIIVALIMLGRKFAFRTFCGSMLTTLFLYFFGNYFPEGIISTHTVWGDLLVSVLLIGIASALLFSIDASSGGTDIPAMIIHDRKGIEIGRALFITDILIAVSSGLLFGISKGISSVIGLALKALLIDLFMKLIKKKINVVMN